MNAPGAFDLFGMTDAYAKLVERNASESEIDLAYRTWCAQQMVSGLDRCPTCGQPIK